MHDQRELSSHSVSDMTISYRIDDNDTVGLSLYPSELVSFIPERRRVLNDEPTVKPLYDVFHVDYPAVETESLVQLKIVGDGYPGRWSGGMTMRNGSSTENLKYVSQDTVVDGDRHTIATTLTDERGVTAIHRLSFRDGRPFVEIGTELVNNTSSDITLEMLSSFSLGGLSPFQADAGVGKYRVHRFFSCWSAEGRHESRPIEHMNLEESWCGYAARSLRFGQVGSLPVRGCFPFVAFEDTEFDVLWGAQLVYGGSWQLEISRRTDLFNIGGGLADRETGHWMKKLKTGESLVTPISVLSCCRGDIYNLTRRLTRYQEDDCVRLPSAEEELPIVFNDWCATWGHPSEENILKIADNLRGLNVRYLVMDDGWFNNEPGIQQGLGDWNPSETIYPNGFGELCNAIRAKGLEPGIWFEFECCTEGSEIFGNEEHLLHRDGHVLQCGNRRFLDFRDPWVHRYLCDKVIGMLKENRIKYIKTDYNDTIGLGCDGAESLGEGLRQHLEGVQAFYRRLGDEIPELVIEICSSGGHRLEPSWMALGSMGSFSDSHEGLDIPILAANTQMLIPARKNQVWAVLREKDSPERLHYSLSATFLGRMCLSGNLDTLNRQQLQIVRTATDLYTRLTPTIREGISRKYGGALLSFTAPKGYQAVVRMNINEQEAFVVAHSFQKAPTTITVPLDRSWKIRGTFKDSHLSVRIDDSVLSIDGVKDHNGLVIDLERC